MSANAPSDRHGIHAIDTGYVREKLDASHLIVRGGRAAFVDCGANSSTPRLMAALAEHGIEPEAVDYLLLTHIHLDHAGGAGTLIDKLPNATVVVHPRGAAHLSEPAKLEAGTRATYGDAVYEKLYGELVPVPAERIHAATDDETIRLGGSRLRCLHTPGHALHHIAYYDEDARAVFTGDIFGISYRVFDNPAGEPFIFPTTTPTQFDPGQMHASIERIAALEPEAVYLTHYSRVGNVGRLAATLHRDVDEFVAIAEAHADEPDAEEHIRHALHDYLARRLAEHGTQITPRERETWLAMDLNLDAAGLVAWMARRRRKS
jgi:glyoxylase-like metal-dependent hydrolase (beta-lactamase superfamily II)